MPDVHRFPSIPTNILVPIDFSPSSQSALDAACDLAEHFQASLVLVNVVRCLSSFALTYAIPDDALRQKMGAHAERLLAKCSQPLRREASPQVIASNSAMTFPEPLSMLQNVNMATWSRSPLKASPVGIRSSLARSPRRS